MIHQCRNCPGTGALVDSDDDEQLRRFDADEHFITHNGKQQSILFDCYKYIWGVEGGFNYS